MRFLVELFKRNGELTGDGHARWCSAHNREHGPLFICEHYSDELKLALESQGDEFRRELSDPAWCKAQIAKGLPPEGIEIFRLFAGL